jgi:hypothetical protein
MSFDKEVKKSLCPNNKSFKKELSSPNNAPLGGGYLRVSRIVTANVSYATLGP